MLSLMAVDPFSTKGVEYILVLLFLGALPVYWKILNRPVRPALQPGLAAARRPGVSGWFRLPETAYYHPGHAWAIPAGQGLWRVGVDDFAQLLLGQAAGLRLPEVGTRLEQGAPGWGVTVDGRTMDVLSPVSGQVVARNDEALQRPDLVNHDPYGLGWLMVVATPDPAPNMKTLLHGSLAQAWMGTTERQLRGRMDRDLGIVMQDGGTPVTGIARAIAPTGWDGIVREFLLTG